MLVEPPFRTYALHFGGISDPRQTRRRQSVMDCGVTVYCTVSLGWMGRKRFTANDKKSHAEAQRRRVLSGSGLLAAI